MSVAGSKKTSLNIESWHRYRHRPGGEVELLPPLSMPALSF